MLEEPRPASGALSKTGGFLCGFSHSLQPYIGCRFGCEYCYVKGLQVHLFHAPPLAWGEYVHPRTGIAEQLRRELARFAARGQLETVKVFMSSATDPYQTAERRWRLARACLEIFAEFPPGVLVVQTRSPLVRDDFALLQRLGNRCWLSVTLETDRDDVRRTLTPSCSSVQARLDLLRAARAAGLQVQAAVSPCLPYSTPATFGALLLESAERVVVDTYTSGDGSAGRRTGSTQIPALHNAHAWHDWRDETQARALFAWLHGRIGDKAGWSQQGFSAITRNLPAEGPLFA